MNRESSIQGALNGLKSGKYKSIRAAAKDKGIPRSTLQYRLKGGQETHKAHEDQQICGSGEEQALINWIQRWHSQGFPIRTEELCIMAQHLILSRGSHPRRHTISTYIVGINWPARFLQRHSYLKGAIVKPIEKSKKDACTPEVFNAWFKRFHDNINKLTPKPEPQNIYNIDETGFILDDGEKAYVIIDKRLESKSRTIKAQRGELLTVIECSSATGVAIPPMIIYKGQHLQHYWFEPKAPRDWVVATSPNGWTSNTLGLW